MSIGTDLFVDCAKCRKPIGELDYGEFLAMWGECGGEVLCFDCEPDEACVVPGIFEDLKPGEVLSMGDMVFVACDTSPITLVNTGFSHTRGNARARSCLSSSTYLNTFINQGGARGRIQDTHWPCSECPEGWLWPTGDNWKCDRCNYFGPKVRAMILPDWILNPGQGFTRKPNSADCPSCAKVKALHDGQGLCDYHQNLYELTFNGDILGVGNE